MNTLQNINFYGLKITSFEEKELEIYLDNCIRQNIQQVCYGHSFASVPLFKKLPEIYYYSKHFDVMVCDGRFFYLFIRLMGFQLKSDISIPGLVKLVLKFANRENYKVMLVGGNEETNAKAGRNLKENYSGIQLLGGFDGYFNESDEPLLIEKINKASPDILLIGMSSPKKERFAYKWRNSLNAKIIIPCGGMIDVMAGKVKLTPKWLKKIGLATPYRVIQEPRRLLWINIWYTYETFFRIIPLTIWNVKIRKNKKFSIPEIYGINE